MEGSSHRDDLEAGLLRSHAREAALLRACLLPFLALLVVYFAVSAIPGLSASPVAGVLAATPLLVATCLSLVFLRAGRVRAASWLFLVAFFLSCVGTIAAFGGVSGPNGALLTLVVVLAGLLRGWRASLGAALLSALALIALLVIESRTALALPLIRPEVLPSTVVVVFYIAATALYLSLTLRQLERAEAHRGALERQRREAHRLEAVGQLAGGVAHDFNNLLTAIIGSAELLRLDRSLSEKALGRVAQISESGERAAVLTRQLLAFARKQVLEPKVLNPNEVVAALEGLLRRLIREDVELKILPGADAPLIRADRAQLEQIIVNLVVNARDALPDGGRVNIETEAVQLDQSYCAQHTEAAPGPYLSLVVTDTGEGMSSETLDRIFEPFFTTKEGRGGTGLGLSTVHGIVRQSHGHVHVYSEPGRGTSFKVYIPAVEEAAQETAQPATPAGARGQEETIFVIDDDAMVRRVMALSLESAGFRPVVCRNGDHALALAAKHEGEIELLITDVVMPRRSGREIAEQIRGKRPNLSVLFVSGYTENVIAEQGELEQGIHFLAKPFTPDQLTTKVRKVLDGRDERPAEP